MKMVNLGKTGLRVSRVGMGGIPIQRPPMDEAIKVIHRALDLGVNFIDTSIGYGDSEIRIGKVIENRRDQIIVATKGSWRSREAVTLCIERSLSRLNNDYIDLWQFHGVNTFEAYERVLIPGGAMEAAQEALEDGKIRHIGISIHALDMALKAVASGHFETIQFPFNFVLREAADRLVPLAKEQDIGLIAMKPFAGGRLKDAKLAIKFLLQFDNVVPDPGIERMEEIEEIRSQVGPRSCRRCSYCMPCPQGVLIPQLLLIPHLWDLWPNDYLESWKYVKNVVEKGQNCIQCCECEGKCPYNLPIRQMITESLEFYDRINR